MALKNSATCYGSVSRFLHWSVVTLFAFQYLSAAIMTHLARDKTLLGLSQGDLYNWHKSIGLVLLTLALARLIWRKATPLPDWAPVLSKTERAISHRNETLLYGCMFLLPLSGYLFVMAGNFGVKLFGLVNLPNPMLAISDASFGYQAGRAGPASPDRPYRHQLCRRRLHRLARRARPQTPLLRSRRLPEPDAAVPATLSRAQGLLAVWLPR